MRTSVAVVSVVLMGSVAACTARDMGRGGVAARRTSPGPGLVACHRADAPVWMARGTRPENEKVRRARPRAPHPARTLSLDRAQLEAVVTARMPDQDVAFHREIARVIDEEARHAGLDPLLILALIHVESSFDPGAVSYAGAIGLMQVRERTLRREIERSGLAPADARDPVANVRVGIRYLRRLVAAFGNTDVALMAYNAGPNRILSYYRAGEIPERFHAYPRRIRSERERLRSVVERRLHGAAARAAS